MTSLFSYSFALSLMDILLLSVEARELTTSAPSPTRELTTSASSPTCKKETSIKGIERSLNDLLGHSSRNEGDGDRASRSGGNGDRERGSKSQSMPPVRQKEDYPNFSRLTKMKFSRFTGEKPIAWLNRVEQYFSNQQTPDNQKVPLAAFHLEGEANQWWQWLQKIYVEENQPVTWQVFQMELLARFGPTEYEDFDEALSHVVQKATLREYQTEFERLPNRVKSWP
ncbi:hypothetical protein EZV62_010597 [Acer yangbiense]|uniref:Retrotransposon gag domain-containing protein n=1 Tax=Acer yangbiense TaxID=1000413 RepID=A0A5C7I263_9ROSI|nr:hypothetical protein EZV62_010597 [Acer yangbiense]